MEAKLKFQLALAVICVSALGPACAGVIERAGTPSTSHGKFISCHAPDATIGVVRGTNSTTFFQTTPKGIDWKYRLPAWRVKWLVFQLSQRMTSIWLASDGHRSDPATRAR